VGSNVFQSLIVEQIEIFRTSYAGVSRNLFYDEDEKKLSHTGEFGSYREAICRDFLKFFIPGKFAISQGFLINNNDDVSSQCDIIIYDSDLTPLIQSESRQRFFPVETVGAVGEVKSRLDKTRLKDALNKLAATNVVYENTHEPYVHWQANPQPYDFRRHFYDQLFTFLICEKLDLDVSTLSLNDLYNDDIPHRHKHNLILSLEDGLFLYLWETETKSLYLSYPVTYQGGVAKELNHVLVIPTDERKLMHFQGFAAYMWIVLRSRTILSPDFGLYLGESPGSTLSNSRWLMV